MSVIMSKMTATVAVIWSVSVFLLIVCHYWYFVAVPATFDAGGIWSTSLDQISWHSVALSQNLENPTDPFSCLDLKTLSVIGGTNFDVGAKKFSESFQSSHWW